MKKPSSALWRTFSFWVLSTTLINPIAIFIATVSQWLVSPVNLGESIEFIPPDPPLISVLRAAVFGIVAGIMIGITQQAILRPFSKLRFWIPATIIALALGMAVTNFINNSWIINLGPDWLGILWIAIPSALAMAVLQAIVIARAGHFPIWWLVAGGIPFAFPVICFYIAGYIPIHPILLLLLGGLAGAVLSAAAIPATFREMHSPSRSL